MTAVSRSTNTLRPANAADADALARLHADRISEGFLADTRSPLLARLYRRMARSNRATAYVVTEDGRIVAFAAGTTSVGAFYKEFLVHDGVPAALLAAPHAPRAWRHVLETMRYPRQRPISRPPKCSQSRPRAMPVGVATRRARFRQ